MNTCIFRASIAFHNHIRGARKTRRIQCFLTCGWYRVFLLFYLMGSLEFFHKLPKKLHEYNIKARWSVVDRRKITRLKHAKSVFNMSRIQALSVHTRLAVNLDKALLGLLGVVYCSGDANSLLSSESGSLRFLLRAAASCSGVGMTCLDGMASFFSNIFVAKPARFRPYPW